MPPTQNSNQNTVIKVIGAVVVLGLVVFGFSRTNKKEEPIEQVTTVDIATSTAATTSTKPSSTPTPIPTTPPPAPVADNRTYKNGTYSSMGTYSSPSGREDVNISLVITDDVITSATFSGETKNSTSRRYQTLFNEGFSKYVVGKNVDSLKLQVVNGSSLTPKGFMDALVKIKAEAQV